MLVPAHRAAKAVAIASGAGRRLLGQRQRAAVVPPGRKGLGGGAARAAAGTRTGRSASRNHSSSSNSSSNSSKNHHNSNSNKNDDDDESHLNWKDRKEAPKWMRRIAPSKGGKWPPTPQEAVILLSGLAVFLWSWTA